LTAGLFPTGRRLLTKPAAGGAKRRRGRIERWEAGMEAWLERIIAEKRNVSLAAAAARNEELRKRSVFDSKIADYWESLVRDMGDVIRAYNQAEEIKENRVGFQKLPDLGVLIEKKALPSGVLSITVDRQSQSLRCRYTHESVSGVRSEDTVVFSMQGKHVGLPLTLVGPNGATVRQGSILETILSRFLTAV
jgi:hypothetical protein